MSDPQPRLVESRRVYDGKIVNVDLDTIESPAGHRIELEIVRHQGAAAVVPLLSDPESSDPTVLLLRQYRYAAGGEIWEVPAGVLEPGEDPTECARRELLEETGARAERVERLTTVFTTPGFTDEIIHLFMATGITAGEPNTARDEFIKTETLPMSRAMEMIRDGEIRDAKSIVALLYTAGFRLNW
ncbi:MAG: NUDIX hydrolase [Gemmatimonadales bacterium]